MGVDVGSSSCKASLFDANGRLASFGYQEYAEKGPIYDPDVILRYTLSVIKGVVKNSGVEPASIKGVGVGTFIGGFIPIDKTGKQCMLWSHQATTGQTKWIENRLSEKVYPKLPGNLESKILWVKENRPDIFEKTDKFLQFKDYLEFKLTGEVATEWCEASLTMLFDIKKLKWSDEIATIIGIDIDKLPEVKSPTSIIGGVTKAVSEQTGLKKGTYVVGGAFDDAVALLGLNAVKPNREVVYNIAGTNEDFDVCLDYVVAERPEYSSYEMEIICHVIPKVYILHFGFRRVGALFRWFRDELGGAEAAKAKDLGVDPYSLMDKEAESIEPGSGGLIFHRPRCYGGDKGFLLDLSLSHTRAHIIRAIMESGAFEFMEQLGIFKRLGISAKEVVATGGCSKSRTRRQIIADVLGLPVHLTNVDEPGCLGAAILAGVGAGVYKDPITAIRDIVHIEDTRNPQKDAHGKYKKIYELRRSTLESALQL